jgi:myo-inositol-1(or 4)-monophosphatase
MDLEKTCAETIYAVRKAGNYINEQLSNRAGQEIEQKGQHDFVTSVDKAAEAILVRELGNIVPEAGFITEEGTRNNKNERYNWIIDPLDGTTNFIHGAFPFAVSVALTKNDKPVAGVILELGLNECFYGWQGGGAFLDGKPISVSKTKNLDNSLIATGFPYTNFERMEQFMQTVDWFMRHSRGLRRLGSAATDIAWVACGRYDGFYEYGLKAWDVAAGVIILQEAGGRCADFSGNDNFLFGEEIVCSNNLNYNEFIRIIAGTMNGK